MNQSELAESVRSHYAVYYNTLREAMAKYGSSADMFPTFMRGNKYLVITLCQDGVTVSHSASDEDAVEVERTDETVMVTSKRLTDGKINIDYKEGEELALYTSDLVARLGPNPTVGRVIWRAPWDRFDLHVNMPISHWDLEKAYKEAQRDVDTIAASRLLNIPAAKTNELFQAYKEVIQEIEARLSTNPREEELQKLLTKNPILLSPIAVRVIAKHALGAEYVTDYVIELPGAEYVLVEIEPSRFNLFTKAGDPTSHLTHAIRQVQDWRQWIHENLSYARKTLPEINEPSCLVVIGRSHNMRPRDKTLLQRMNAGSNYVRVKTYDDIIREAKQHLANLKNMNTKAR